MSLGFKLKGISPADAKTQLAKAIAAEGERVAALEAALATSGAAAADGADVGGFGREESVRGFGREESVRGFGREESVRGFEQEESVRLPAALFGREESVRGFGREESVRGFGREESVRGFGREESVRGFGGDVDGSPEPDDGEGSSGGGASTPPPDYGTLSSIRSELEAVPAAEGLTVEIELDGQEKEDGEGEKGAGGGKMNTGLRKAFGKLFNS